MTRKDYRLIAGAIHERIEMCSYTNDNRKNEILAVAGKISDALKSDNARFKPTTFLRAVQEGI